MPDAAVMPPPHAPPTAPVEPHPALDGNEILARVPRRPAGASGGSGVRIPPGAGRAPVVVAPGVPSPTELVTAPRPGARPRAVRPPTIPVPRTPASVRHAWVSPETRRAYRRLLVVLVLSPILLLVATRVANLTVDPLLGLYGFLTLAITTTLMYVAFVHYRDPSTRMPVDPFAAPMSVSCLVAVKDEFEVIESCVLSLLDSDHPDLEVIVVDDGSTDGTTELLADLAAEHAELRVLPLPRSVGKKYALSIGTAFAEGDVFVYTDSDCVMAPDAIGRCVAALAADPDLGAVSGHARALNADESLLTKVQDTWYDGQFSVWKAAESTWGAVTCVSGPLAVFRRAAVYNFLPAWANDRFLGQEFRFATDRQLTGYVLAGRSVGRRIKAQHRDNPFVYREDHEERDWKIGYVKSARVWTVVPSTFRKVLRQQVRWKKSFIRNLFFTGRFYWRRGPLPALVFYAHVLFVLATPFMAFRHLVWMPAHGAWLLTGVYLAGVLLKGGIWGLAYRAENPRDGRWVYRPLMSVLTVTVFSWLILYSALTLRKQVWHRG